MRWWAWAFTRPTLVTTFKDLIQSSKQTGRCLERWWYWQLWWHCVLPVKILGCFPVSCFPQIMEDRIYSQAPSRFPINTGYVEVRNLYGSHLQLSAVINSCWKVFQGWALYSEGLGYDIDMYGNPLDRYKTDTSPKQWEVEVPFFQFWPPERRDLPRLPPRRWHGDARARLDPGEKNAKKKNQRIRMQSKKNWRTRRLSKKIEESEGKVKKSKNQNAK